MGPSSLLMGSGQVRPVRFAIRGPGAGTIGRKRADECRGWVGWVVGTRISSVRGTDERAEIRDTEVGGELTQLLEGSGWQPR